MRSASVATGIRRSVLAPESRLPPRTSRPSWRRLPFGLQKTHTSRRTDWQPVATYIWPRVLSRRGYILAPCSAPACRRHGRGWCACHPHATPRSSATCSTYGPTSSTPAGAVSDVIHGPCPMRECWRRFAPWCLRAVAITTE